MANTTLRFPSKAQDAGQRSYKLLELPPELAKLVESGDADALSSITIRGQTDDDAVLCTKDKTYAIRAVSVSNSFLVVTGDDQRSGSETETPSSAIIRDQLHEIMELVPIVPKLGRLAGILRDSMYTEEDDADDDSEMEDDAPNTKRRRYTYNQIRGLIQASDTELDQSLKDQHILRLSGTEELRQLSPQYLTKILTYILTTLVSSRYAHTMCPFGKLSQELVHGYNVRPQVLRQVAGWFGEIKEAPSGAGAALAGKEVWVMDVEKVVTQIGLSVLIKHQHEALTEDQICQEWKDQVGDTFASSVNLSLLKGSFVDTSDPPSTYTTTSSHSRRPPLPRYKYFAASELPLDPAKRFKDLFLTRPSWNIEQLAPFLAGIAVDKKERDKLLMKFTRSEPPDADGVVWYYSRAKT